MKTTSYRCRPGRLASPLTHRKSLPDICPWGYQFPEASTTNSGSRLTEVAKKAIFRGLAICFRERQTQMLMDQILQ